MFLAVLLIVMMVIPTSTAEASCQTHKCWQHVHEKRLENMVQKRIDRITPYSCWTITGPFRSAKPCWVIAQESATVKAGPWNALNTWTGGAPCLQRACGPYQFLGWNVPWPVIVKSKYETLKRKLAHHRQAAHMSISNW